MLTSIRGLLAATALAGCAMAATPALADETDAPSEFTITGNVAVVTDYRFRGLSASGGDIAVQGGINVNHKSGFYIGTWASSLQSAPRSVLLDNAGVVTEYTNGTYGSTEVDIFGGWTGEVTSGLTADVGLLYYYYPNGTNRSAVPGLGGPSGYPRFVGYNDYPTDYFEPYASLTGAIGPATAKVGVAYAWDQDALGGSDNLYVFTDLSAGIPNTPVSLSAHLGYADGVQSPKLLTGSGTGGGFDWNVGATFAVTKNLSVTGQYVGVQGNSIDGYSDDTVVGTLKLSF
jgi:uncharacterized protein (TIGR02001 family)